MRAYLYNWPATQYIILVLYDKIIIIAKNFSDILSTFEFWALDSDLDNIQLTDFRLCFQTRTLDIIQTVFRHRTSDFVRLCTSDYRLWTLNISFQTSYCGLWTYFRRRIIAFIVRHRTEVKLQTQRLGQFICHTTKTNIHM